MDTSIVIPTYNRNSILYKHLAIAYAELKGSAYEIIVINDSKTNIVAVPGEWRSNITVVNNPKQGVASARNLGASLARSEYIIFADDDMIINRNAVEHSIDFLKKNPRLNEYILLASMRHNTISIRINILRFVAKV